ncbi:MAG: SelT/SelW/SelH family protein [Deferribacteres bacterium]|nr:Rdx family protein [candidate division KSB1 bacterium]MCB9500554.1 SelT/SelW/SelH family protein [Deferribacteres bacterium]
MKAALEKAFPGVNIDLIASSGGVFEISLNGDLLYSKKQSHVFPEEEMIIDVVAASRNWQ